jgi:xylitol oxidase
MGKTNWAGNQSFSATTYSRPESLDEIRRVVERSAKIKVLGAGHSFNTIADTTGTLMSLDQMTRILSLDQEARQVTVEGGVRYGPLCRFLEQQGFALPNLASLPHITVAGACATATHGSGDGNGNLATSVASLELVTADGELVELSRHQDDVFDGAVVGLGALGVVTKLTLDVVPSFTIRQQVFENLPLAQALDHLDGILGLAYSVSLFSDWQAPRFQVWVKRRVSEIDAGDPQDHLWDAAAATRALHPIPGVSAVHCTEQLAVPGAWHERLPHFRLDFTPSNGEELQSEYLLPRTRGREALAAVSELRGLLAPVLLVSEIRSVAADSLWLSPNYHRDSIAFHFTWKKDWPAVREVLAILEDALLPLGAYPHWGKLCAMKTVELQRLFEKWPDFQRLRQRFDPQEKFGNDFLG